MPLPLTAAIYENNYQAQDKFAEALQLRSKAWSNIEAGRKLYEPLPQTPEEAVLWQRFQGEWTAWKGDDDKVRAILRQLAENRDEQQQKPVRGVLQAVPGFSRALFGKAEGTLNEIIKLNNGVADASVKDGSAAVIPLGKPDGHPRLAGHRGGHRLRRLHHARDHRADQFGRESGANGGLGRPDESHIEVQTTEETGQLLQALKDMNSSLVSIVGQVRGVARRPSPRPRRKLPAATWTCLRARRSKPARWKRRRRRWKN